MPLPGALLADFDILFLDEPYKGLDAETKRAVQGAVGEYTRNKTVVLVTHDPAEAEGYRLVEMKPDCVKQEKNKIFR